jgi:hypothetical protein
VAIVAVDGALPLAALMVPSCFASQPVLHPVNLTSAEFNDGHVLGSGSLAPSLPPSLPAFALRTSKVEEASRSTWCNRRS